MQSINSHLDLDNFVMIIDKHNIKQSVGSKKTQTLSENTFSFFKLENILGYKKAIFISKLHYWLNKCGRNIEDSEAKWIYNTIKDWAEQFNWSVSTLKRIVSSLEEEEIIISKKINARKWNHTKWYSIDYNKLDSLLNVGKKLINDSEKKRANGLAQKELIIKSNTSNNYTYNSSYKEKNSDFEKYITTVVEKKLEEKLSNLKINNNNEATHINYENKKREKKIIDKETKEKPLNLINAKGNEKNTAYQMIELWNKVFECAVNPIKAYSNKKNSKILLYLLKTKFGNDLDHWREYALKVNSSQFLMGEKKTKTNFKAIFSWLIKPETIEKILNGEYGVGDRELDMNNISKNEEIKKEDTVNKIDSKVSERLRLNINESKEKEEFENYVRESGYEEDGDIYKISKIFKQIPKYSFFNLTEYKEMRKTLLDSYVVKKYMGMDRIEMRDLIRNKIGEENQINSMKYLK